MPFVVRKNDRYIMDLDKYTEDINKADYWSTKWDLKQCFRDNGFKFEKDFEIVEVGLCLIPNKITYHNIS